MLGPRFPSTDVAVHSKGTASGKKPTTPKSSTKKSPASKASKKTSKAKASTKKKTPRDSSERSSRARPQPDPIAIANLPPAQLKLGNWGRGAGRPKDTPDVWTPAHKLEVANWLFEYTDSVELPSVAEFCRLYGIRFQRLGEFEELAEGREYLQAKRASAIEKAAVSTVRETGCRVAFFARMAANTGVFSLVDKVETENKNTNVQIYAIPANGREGKG